MNQSKITSNNADVGEFHKKFGVPEATEPSLLPQSTYDFRIEFMQEELDEYRKAVLRGNLLAQADALIDLAYVVHGTARMQGLPWQELWDCVHRANMQKVRATQATDSKRGTALDVVKPAGWTPPDFVPIIGNLHGVFHGS